jgi:hypothetical protein
MFDERFNLSFKITIKGTAHQLKYLFAIYLFL